LDTCLSKPLMKCILKKVSNMRKKTRKDSKHLIYEIVNTISGRSYIGITSLSQFYHTKSKRYAALRRFQKHYSKAMRTKLDWELYRDMREYGKDVYDVFIVDVVKGKALAHQIETELLKEFEYELNSTH
jgi:hypothetical protein